MTALYTIDIKNDCKQQDTAYPQRQFWHARTYPITVLEGNWRFYQYRYPPHWTSKLLQTNLLQWILVLALQKVQTLYRCQCLREKIAWQSWRHWWRLWDRSWLELLHRQYSHLYLLCLTEPHADQIDLKVYSCRWLLCNRYPSKAKKHVQVKKADLTISRQD